MMARRLFVLVFIFQIYAVSSAYAAVSMSDQSPFPLQIAMSDSRFFPEIGGSVVLENTAPSFDKEILLFVQGDSHGTPPREMKMFKANGAESRLLTGSSTLLPPAAADLDNNAGNGKEIVFTDGSILYAYYSDFTQLWTFTVGAQISPAVADIDDDGNLEVIVADTLGNINALSNRGGLKWSKSLGCTVPSYSSLAIGDFEPDDSSLEIVVACTNGNIYVVKSGEIIRTIPTGDTISIFSRATPVIGDINDDGELEIILATQNKLNVFDKNGGSLPGWPVSLGVDEGGRTSLGDLDGDGRAEIVVRPFKTWPTEVVGIYVYYSDGSLAWSNVQSARSQAIIADVDGDYLPEVIVNTNDGIKILKNGEVVYSQSLSGTAYDSSPAIGNADSDANLEIALAREGSGGAAKVYLLEASSAFNPSASPWLMFQADAMHTGMLSPAAGITSPANGSVFNIRNIIFSGYALSPSGGISYEWISDINGTLSTGKNFTGWLMSGIHKITFRATEASTGKVDEDVVYINVLNALPQVNITSPLNNSVYNIGERIYFNVSASDSDGHIAKYEWDFHGDGVYEYSSTTAGNRTESYSSPGNYTAYLRVTDNEGGTTVKSVSIRINSPPTATITSPTGELYTLGEPITFSCNCTDSDGSIASYNWSSSIDGFLSGSSSFTIASLKNGTHVITLKITDNEGANATASKTIKVNIPPLVNITSPAPGTYILGNQLQFNSSAYDPDGAVSSYTWSSDRSGVLSTSSSFSAALQGGKHTITLMVTDSDGMSANTTAEIRIINQNYAVKWGGSRSFIPGSVVAVSFSAFDSGTGMPVNDTLFTVTFLDPSGSAIFTSNYSSMAKAGDSYTASHASSVGNSQGKYTLRLTSETAPQNTKFDRTIYSSVYYSGKSIRFDAVELFGLTESDISSYTWDFGNETTGSGRTTQHAYSSAGTFTVKLTAVYANGSTYDGTLKLKVNKAGDVNGDGTVNLLDLTVLGLGWKKTEADDEFDPRIDINKDGKLDISDVAEVAFRWS